MAEIPVEKKSNLTWLWIVLAIVLIGLLLWWVLAEDDDVEALEGDAAAIEQPYDAEGDPMAAGTEGEMTIAAILANPQAYYGQEGFETTATVGGPLTDRGFWIENDGARMFAIVIDQPAERPIDINPGATLRIDGGTLREASTITADGIEGDPLDEDTMEVIADQDVVLVVDEANITIEQDA